MRRYNDVAAARIYDSGLRMDTSGANDFPTSNEPNRDPQHISVTDQFGTGRLFAQSHQFLENVKVIFPLSDHEHLVSGGEYCGGIGKGIFSRKIVLREAYSILSFMSRIAWRVFLTSNELHHVSNQPRR
jgi:hypothetical protein